MNIEIINQIPLKYKVPLQGRMNKGVYSCFYPCDFVAPHYDVTPYIKGFADSNYGTMVVWECPLCFKKSYFHYRGDMYGFDYILRYEEFLKGGDDWDDRAMQRTIDLIKSNLAK